MLKASGDVAVGMAADLLNTTIKKGTVPDDWLRRVTVNVCKGKGDALEHGNYRSLNGWFLPDTLP